MDAVDETIFDSDSRRLARNLFGDDPHVAKAELKVSDCIGKSFASMRGELAAVTIENLLQEDRDRNGSIEWESKIR